MDRYLVILLLVWAVSCRPIEDLPSDGKYDEVNANGEIVRSVIGEFLLVQLLFYRC